MDYHILTLVLAIAAGAHGGPARQRASSDVISTCSTTCTGNNKFSYAVGSTYQYKYEAETRTSMLGASEDHSTIGITANIDIEVQSKCELILKVQDTSIFAFDSRQYADQDPTKEFAGALEQYPLRFSFQDGVLVSVCPHDDDKTWSVNIKKGILSALQNSMDSFDIDYKGVEDDVTGKCDTEYKVSQRGWRSITFKKTKTLSSCSHRQGFDSAIQTSPFRVSSGMKSLPIMKSSHECDQEVSTKGTLISSVCHEIHLFRPFSKDTSGANTEVTQKLTFIQKRATNSQASVVGGEPEELFFKHAPETDVSDLSAKNGLDLLRDLCGSKATDVTPATSKQFSQLVSIMKKIDFSGLKRIYNQVNRDTFCRAHSERIRNFAMDAIPMVGTDASIELMKTLINDNIVTGTMAEMWLASLAFVHHPTKEMIKYIQELTGFPSLETKVLLPLSVMVQSYCRVNPLCGEVQEVKDFIDILERNLESGCKVDQQNFRKIMMTLRALGNTGHAEVIVPSIYKCIEEADNPMDIRVAAVQAFRRLDCAADRNNLMGIYRDDSRDSELRIAAYLAVMRCPNSYFISQIKETLASEEVNQVGSFVWSHLTNLMESSDPENKYIQQLLDDQVLDKEFDMEKMKFSRNYEASLYMDKWNTGAKADSNVVWSSKSFVPRSATLNLTFNLFGESMNLFEIGGRVEGLETMLESYFGPVGYYNDKDRESNKIPDADPAPARLSAKKFDNIKKQAKTTRDQLRGALYMRMFGNELSYNMFGSNNGIDDTISGSDMFNFLQKIRNNEQQEISLTKNVMFIDSTYTIPTVVGLPLKLSVNGSATTALNVGGHVDMKNPLSTVLIEGNFEPSGSVEIDSMMGIDAVVTKGALKMVSTLYTSTGAKAKIQLDGGNVFDLTFDLTKEKSEILDVKSSFYITFNDVEKEQKMITENRQENTMCTGPKLIRAAGIEFCASVSTPNATSKTDAPYFPFTGPVHISVELNKQDMPNGYKLEAKYIKTPVMSLFRVKSDTPASTNDRAIGLDLIVSHKDKTLDVSLLSPWKKATMKGQLLDTAVIKGLTANINVDDDTRVYNLDAKIMIDNTKDHVTYTPQISLEIPDWKNIQVSGVMNLVVKKSFESFESDLIISGFDDSPITMKTQVMNTASQLGMLTQFSQEEDEGYMFEAMTFRKVEKKKLRSRYQFTPRVYVRTPRDELVLFTADINCIGGKSLKANAKLEKLTKTPFTMNVDLSQVEIPKKKRVKYLARVKMDGPKLANKLMVMIDNRGNKNIYAKTRLDYNIARKWRDTITTNSRVKLTLYKNRQTAKITSDFKSVNNQNLANSLSVTYEKTQYKTKLDAALKYGLKLKDKATKDRIDLSLLAVTRERQAQTTVNYTVNVKFPPKDIDVTITGGNVYSSRTVASDIKIQYHPERTVAFGVRYHNRTTLFHNYAGALSIYLPEGREMSFYGAFGKESMTKYISELEFEIIKGRKTRVDTALKIATDKIYEFEVGVKVPDIDEVRFLGAFSKQDTGYTVEAAYQKSERIYKFFSEVTFLPENTGKVVLDLSIPSRRVKLIVGSTKMDTERHYMFDVQWDADKNLDDRFLTNITIDVKSKDDFEVSTTLHYPSRTIEFNIKHNSAARYITNLELSWSPKEKIEFNIIFRDDVYNGADRTELTVGFGSPFKGYEDLGLAVSLVKNSEQFQIKSSVTWANDKKILVSTTAKVPVSPESIDIVGTISTPFKDYETMTSMLKHRLRRNDLQSNVLVQWGRKRFSINTDGDLQYTRLARSFNGNIDIRTPFEALRVLVLKGEHSDNYRKFNSKFTMDTSYTSENDINKYNMDIEMDHDSGLTGLVNTGKISITMPNDDITTDWEVSQQMGRSRAMLDIQPRRGNQFKVELLETHQLLPTGNILSSKFELLIPTEAVRELQITFSHEDKPDYVKTNAAVTKDNMELISATVGYNNNPGSLQLDSLIKSAYSEDVVFKVSSVHSIMPYTGKFELSWGETPWKISGDSNIFYNEFGRYKGTVNLNIPVQAVQRITITTKHERTGLNWLSSSSLGFGRQKMGFDILYRYDHVKFADVTIKTNFPQFPGLSTSVRLDGTAYDFNGDASFTMVPYVGKTSTDFRWSYYEGSRITGAFNLNTPFPQYPYLKSSFDSNMMGVSRVSKFELEYLPTQVLKIETDHRFTSAETLEGTVKITSPYTENKEVVAGFTHVGNREEFRTKAKITCDCFKRPVLTEATFSSKKDIISTFVMNSPFRGYQTVKWDFKHQNLEDGFHTKAEYETNGKKISYENLLTMKDKIQCQVTLLSPFITNHVMLSHEGDFPNTKTHAEFGYNETMVKSDFELTHNTDSTIANAVVTTPFERYENIRATISRTGPVTDFVVSGDLDYSLSWHASLKHKFNDQGVFTSALLQCPYLEEDVSLKCNYTGKPLDSHTNIEYTMGKPYTSTLESRFLYDLPNVIVSSKSTVQLINETRVSGVTLKHVQNIEPKDIDISSQFLVQIQNEQKVNCDFYLNINNVNPKDITLYLITEIPHPDFLYNKLYYEVKTEVNKRGRMKCGNKFSFETPQLYKFESISAAEFDEKTYKLMEKITYGDDMKWTREIFWQKGVATLKMTTPHEGFESSTIELTYTHPEPDIPITNFNTDITITTSALENPVKISTRQINTFYVDDLTSLDGSVKLVYAQDERIVLEYQYKEGTVNGKLQTSYEGYEASEVDVMYSKAGGSLGITSSALAAPIKYTLTREGDNLYNFDVSQELLSGFTNYTHLSFAIGNKHGDGTYKPYLKMAQQDYKGEMRGLDTEATWAWDIKDTANVKVVSGINIKNPYSQFNVLNLRLGHEHSIAPLRVRDMATVGYNGKDYLDVDTEFSSVNKLSGIVTFRAPREMEFSFSGLNEGESVDADLMLNWNKQVTDSNFRMEFALSDTGNRVTEKKNFQLKIINPSRTINIVNKYEKSAGKVNSYGTVAWDVTNGKQIDYEATVMRIINSNGETHSSELSVTVPSRKVEMTGSYMYDDSQIQGAGSLLWDANKDKQKRVEVNLDVKPMDVKKMARLDVQIPNLNKDLSLSTELAVNEGPHVLEGQTTFSYAPNADKAVVLNYIITNENTDTLNYKAGWSIEHVDTNTHCEMSASMISQDDSVVSDVTLKYRGNQNKDVEALTFHSELDTTNRDVSVMLSTPYQSAGLSGHMTPQSPYTVSIETSRNNKLSWKSVWNIDTEARTLEATMSYDDLKSEIVTKAFFPNDTSFVSETETSGEYPEHQGRVAAELNKRVLHGHLKWRPGMVKDITNYGAKTLQQLTAELSPVVETGMKDFGSIMMSKHRVISASLAEELAPVTDAYEEEVKIVQQDLRQMRRELKKMYRQNELYLRTIEETYSGTVKAVLAGYSLAIEKLNIAYTKTEELMEKLSQKIDEYPFQEKYNAMVQTVSDAIQKGETIMREEVDFAMVKLINGMDKLTAMYDDTLNEISEQFRIILEGLLDELALTPYMDDVKTIYDKLSSQYKDLTDVDQQQLQKMLLQVHQMFVDAMEQSTLPERYKKVYTQTQKIISEHFGGLAENQDILDMQEALEDLYEQVSWVYKYTEMKMSLKTIIQTLFNKLRSKVMEEFDQLPLGLLDLHKSKIPTFDLENGEVEFDLYLPIPMDNFDEVMRFTVNKYIAKLQKMADKYFPRRDICLWDIFYKLPHKRWSTQTDWVPPFDVIGTVSGKQHFMTFDGHHYDISGLCSYVLAQDLVDGNFSVALKYTGGPRTLTKESLITMMDGKTVEIFQTYMVKIDGQPTELPYRSDRLTIVRTSNHKVELKSNVGLTVITDFNNDYHIISLSGWYFGKVGGLLGNFDGETHNEIMRPDGGVEKRMRRYLNAWEVDTKCRSTMMYTTGKPSKPSEECAAIFDASTSSLRPCFIWVNPEPYRESCDINPEALCDIAHLYRTTCAKQKLIDLSIPVACVKCEGEDSKEFSSEDQLRYETDEEGGLQAHNSMDVVFVVEERQCNRDMANKLKKVVSRLENKLNNLGTNNNRYSLVGYEGSDISSHTMEGQIFNDANKFAMGLENLHFKNLGPYTDPLSAIMYTTQLPFRTGVMKTVVLVSCSPCEEAEGYSYSQLSSDLIQRDFTLHVLRETAFKLKTNSRPKSQIYGLDNEKLIYGQQSRNKKDLFEDIDIPQDYCASLALATNGTVFDSGNMMVGSVRHQTSFMDKFGVTMKPEFVSPCQACSCELDQDGMPRSVCRRCDMQSVYFKPATYAVKKLTDLKNTFVQNIQSLL